MILVIDTSRKGVMLGVYDSVSFAAKAEIADLAAKGDQLDSLLKRMLAEAGVSLKEIAQVLVTLGPGSFTGIRTGVAYAQGLCLGGERTLHGVSTLQALRTHLEPGAEEPVVLPARKGYFYVGGFRDGAYRESLEREEDLAENAQNATEWGIAPFARLAPQIPPSLVQEANYLQESYAERAKDSP
jgi:tRNA threonylcarbamoyladenosine biosynthesis protein TsaB